MTVTRHRNTENKEKKTSLKRAPGTYVLILHCEHETIAEIGALGQVRVRPGYYAYVGSAHGPGGLRARVRHHLSPTTRNHWHIDYLKALLPIIAVWYVYGSEQYEHEWASQIRKIPGAEVGLKAFGSSDCTCETHLYRFKSEPEASEFEVAALMQYPIKRGMT